MHYEVLHSIFSSLHTNEMLEICCATYLLKSLRSLLDQFLCHRDDGCFFYRNDFLNEKCLKCGDLSIFLTCLHEGCEEYIGKTLVSKKVYEIVKCTLNNGVECSRCELVAKKMSVADFTSDFKEKKFYKYARHSHRS